MVRKSAKHLDAKKFGLNCNERGSKCDVNAQSVTGQSVTGQSVTAQSVLRLNLEKIKRV